jgi:hypothetical protein
VFGLFDPDGWPWATTKAAFWLLVIILALGYVPDRAYYFLVSRTIDLGIIGWSPVNLCPPENSTTMPCPVPAGAILPWQASPAELALPAGRTKGAATQIGTNLLYIGGSDGSAASAITYVAKVDKGNFGSWAEGPALIAAREDASLTNLNGTSYLLGGLGPDGNPTTTVWSLGLDTETGALGSWKEVKALALPEPRSGAAAVALTDGLLVVGGWDASGKATNTVWKSTLDKAGALGAFKEQPPLLHPIAEAAIAFEGAFVWVYGGSDDNGAVGAVQRASIGSATAPSASGAPAASGAAPAASGAAPAASGAAAASPSASGAPQGVTQWGVQDAANLTAARTGAAGFSANGAIYLVGGSDGASAKRELYWALPDTNGNLKGGWLHLDPTDLPAGVVDGAPVVAGSTVIILGGTSDGSPLAGAYRASLAPQAPFFRLGLVGVTVPGLQIGGEIGQQLGYLAAAGVGTGNFVLLVVLAVLFNNRPQIRAWMERRRLAREAKAPEGS